MAGPIDDLPLAPWVVSDINTDPEPAFAESLSGRTRDAMCSRAPAAHIAVCGDQIRDIELHRAMGGYNNDQVHHMEVDRCSSAIT